MNEGVTIVINDVETGKESLAIVRFDAEKVSLCLSRQDDGDLEVVMGKREARQLLEALRVATELVDKT